MEKYDLSPEFELKTPTISETAFVAKGAQVVGDVHLGADASVWYNAVLRGDINHIKIGARTNIQDGVVIHLENDRACEVGEDVTVGHGAILHGCTIESGVMIGMGAIVLNGAIVKKGAVIGAGAVVKENTIVAENTLYVGVPAKPVKTLPDQTYQTHIKWAEKYVKLSKVHKQHAGKLV